MERSMAYEFERKSLEENWKILLTFITKSWNPLGLLPPPLLSSLLLSAAPAAPRSGLESASCSHAALRALQAEHEQRPRCVSGDIGRGDELDPVHYCISKVWPSARCRPAEWMNKCTILGVVKMWVNNRVTFVTSGSFEPANRWTLFLGLALNNYFQTYFPLVIAKVYKDFLQEI